SFLFVGSPAVERRGRTGFTFRVAHISFPHAPPPNRPRIPLFFLLFGLALPAAACPVAPAIKSAHPLRLRMRSDRERSSLDSPVVIVLTACSYWFGTVRKIFRRMTFSIWESVMGLR